MKWIVFSTLALFLAGCVGAAPGYGAPTETASPYHRKADGEALIAQADADLYAAEQAQLAADRESARKIAEEQALTDLEKERLFAPVAAQETALAIRRQEATLEAETSARHAQETQSAQALLARQIELAEKQARADREIKKQLQKQEFDWLWFNWILPAAVLLIPAGVAVALFVIFKKREDERLRQARQDKSVMLLTDGVVRVVVHFPLLGNGKPSGKPQVIYNSEQEPAGGNGSKPSILNATWGNGDTVREIGASGNVTVSKARVPDNSTTGRALGFVQSAIRVAGPYKDIIPGWRKMGSSSSEWQRDIAPLVSAGLLEKVEQVDENKRKNVSWHLRMDGAYTCLLELEQALRGNRLVLRPAPTPLADSEITE